MENKPKRAPSKWNTFLKGCIPKEPKDMGMGEKVSACGIQYRELKEKDPKKLEDILRSIKMKENKEE